MNSPAPSGRIRSRGRAEHVGIGRAGEEGLGVAGHRGLAGFSGNALNSTKVVEKLFLVKQPLTRSISLAT
jgi:hypothetical protein